VTRTADRPSRQLSAAMGTLAITGYILPHMYSGELFPNVVDGHGSSSGFPFSVDLHDAVDQVL
jgi:hypothetical protein